jgi:hypothetical protein
LDIKYTMGIPPAHHERERNKRCEEGACSTFRARSG